MCLDAKCSFFNTLKSFDTVEDEHAKNMGRWLLSEVQLFCDGIRRYVRVHLFVYLLGKN